MSNGRSDHPTGAIAPSMARIQFPLPQLRNRRSCQIIRGIRSHCSLRIEQWPGDGIPPQEASHSYETAGPGGSPEESGAIAHPELSNGPDTGQEYLSRRGRVEALVMEHRGYYDRRFRGGVLSAVHHFSLNSENEDDLLRQVNVLRAGQEPGPSGAGAAQERKDRPPARNH